MTAINKSVPERVEEMKDAYRRRLQILAPETDLEYDVVLFGKAIETALTETDQQARESVLSPTEMRYVVDFIGDYCPILTSDSAYRNLSGDEKLTMRNMKKILMTARRKLLKALSNPPSQV